MIGPQTSSQREAEARDATETRTHKRRRKDRMVSVLSVGGVTLMLIGAV